MSVSMRMQNAGASSKGPIEFHIRTKADSAVIFTFYTKYHTHTDAQLPAYVYVAIAGKLQMILCRYGQ